MNEEEKLPIRVVRSDPKYVHEKRRGGPKTLFSESDEEFKQKQKSLLQAVDIVQGYFQESFQEYPQIPHVSKVQLIEKAIAKSHRPTSIFFEHTCPIMGVGKLGQLFVRTDPKGLKSLKNAIEQEPPAETTKYNWKANISAVSNFDPFTEDDRLEGETLESLIEFLERDRRSVIKVKLFNFFDSKADQSARKGFVKLVNQLDLFLNRLGESIGLEILKVGEIDIESLRKLISFPAIRELSIFPRYKAFQPQKKQTAPITFIPSPEKRDYPLVGLLDTGIPKKHILTPWIIKYTNFVRPELSDHYHGCTVATLLIMAHYFNDSLDIDNGFLKVCNVEILGGKHDHVYEDDLIERVEKYFKTSNSFPKIWNMSLGFPEKCEFKRFSDMAIFLDKLQDQHDLLFVLPSGNYDKKPFRKWPSQIEDIRNLEINEDDPDLPPDYLSKPADCVRAITVGAIACDEKETSLVHKDQPAYYSRKGPGPSFIPKPEVVHYSGNASILEEGIPNCTDQGIKSLNDKGITEDCTGTSYAAPLVSRNLAFLEHYIESKPSSLLLKALLIHNSRMLESFGNHKNCFYYVGFGFPTKAVDVLFCSPYEITLIFEDKIRPGIKLEYPFYWPDSLRTNNNKIRGEVKATLVSNPPLNGNFGAEYIRADVRFSLQSKKTKKSGEEVWEGIVPEDPCSLEVRKRYESSLIRQAFKWATVKRYYKKLRGQKSEGQKVKIGLFLRDGPDMYTFEKNIKFALILTLRDPARVAPVYNDITSRVRARGLLTEEIRIRGRAREMVRKKIQDL